MNNKQIIIITLVAIGIFFSWYLVYPQIQEYKQFKTDFYQFKEIMINQENIDIQNIKTIVEYINKYGQLKTTR